MNIYTEINMQIDDCSEDDLKEVVESVLSRTRHDYLRNCIVLDTHYSTKTPNISDDDIDRIAEKLVDNSEYIFELKLPYEVNKDPKEINTTDYELVAYNALWEDVQHKIKQRKLRLVWCENEDAIESHLDSGGCILLYKKDSWGIVCYCDSGHRIILES